MGIMHYLRRRLVARRLTVLAAHVVLYAAAFTIAYLLRFDFTIHEQYIGQFFIGLGLTVVIRTLAGFPFGVYGGVLKYAGIQDLVNIIKAVSIGTVGFVLASVLLNLRDIPRSIFALDWFAAIVLVGGLRFGLRMAREMLSFEGGQGDERIRRVLIVGAGDAGEALVRDIQRTYRGRYLVVGFLDDNKGKRGLRIHDVRVLGPIDYLGDYVPRFRVDEVIIAIPSASGEAMRRIFGVCKIAGVRARTIPGTDQLLDGSVTVNQIRDVAIEDLLGREPVELDEGLLRKFLADKVIMVTGAGGSIGAELCRQICAFRPRKLVLLEQSEPFLFQIHIELVKRHKRIEIVPVIADVTDAVRMERVFERHGPQVIFHAAAHKHVPMMEWNPGEAIKNNVFGTKTVADMANIFGAEAFVMISTDKAVNPTSVMGASKRVSEMYVQSLSSESATKYTAVRFGNVLGSTGSVIPIFQQQIKEGGPLTVTDPEMRRYFMTIPEACQLVMQAAAMGSGGEIFVLDMGEPVKIIDLARDLITLSGFEPDKDIKIEFTGLRPGEKLFEEIGFDSEKMSKTGHPKVFEGKLSPQTHEAMIVKVEFLLGVADETRPELVKTALKAVVPEFEADVDRELVEAAAEARVVEEIVEEKAEERVEGKVEKEIEQSAETEPPRPSPPPPPKTTESRTKERAGLVAAWTGERYNALFDPAWVELKAACREEGLAGVGWATMGIRPPDERREMFDGAAGGLAMIRRSVPIGSMNFVEVHFYYKGESGKRTPSHVKTTVRGITKKLSKTLFRLGREVRSTV